MLITRGNLVAAKIVEVDAVTNKPMQVGGLSVYCMFNPFEYRVSKVNSYTEEPNTDSDTPHAQFASVGPQKLSISLIFDTYETGQDVSLQTREIWKFMKPKVQETGGATEKKEPVKVAFIWGVFKFVAFITSVTQTFTLFRPDGTPVRAKVDVEFTQYIDEEDYLPQNPTSGGGPIEQVWRVIAGDRLDTIAAKVYRDATKWRLIAEHNHIVNPLALRPGQQLRIPIV